MKKAPINIVFYLPVDFYSSVVAFFVETLNAINEFSPSPVFTWEFVSFQKQAVSRCGFIFPARTRPAKKLNVLIVMSPGADGLVSMDLLEEESKKIRPLIRAAMTRKAIIASTCSAAWLLAANGVLDGKNATVSWWLRKLIGQRFPRVRWEPAQILVRDGRLYTTGGGYAGFELFSRLLTDLGFQEQERHVRKMLVIPPSRRWQSPYEIPFDDDVPPFERELRMLVKKGIEEISIRVIARHLGMSTRTLTRHFQEELKVSPGKWIRQTRIEMAKSLLQDTGLSVSEVCYRIGYTDLTSFSRLFTKSTGLGPAEYRRQSNLSVLT